LPAACRAQDGITMIITMLVMLVTSLLLVAAFTAANGDTQLSHTDLTQKQAYYAALAGVQEYEYQLEANPDYWQSCPTLPTKAGEKVKGEESESFEVKTLAAHSDPEGETCNSANPFKTIIEAKAPLANTFRIESVGKSGHATRKLIATFQVAGFLDYTYFTQYEDRDPKSHNGTTEEEEKCPHYRKQRAALGALSKCGTIYFGSEDSVNGPMHTDDTAVVCGGVEFGRKARLEKKEPDAVEMNGGGELGGCGSGEPIYNTTSGKPETKGPELVAPESDGSLKAYVEHTSEGYEYTGRTYLELEGKTNKIKVTTWNAKAEKEEKTVEWPKNGLIYVTSTGAGCGYTEFEQEHTDTTATYEKELNCGSVYVKGTYSSSLTIAAEEDLIINGSIYPTSVKPGEAPGGTTALGLIATRFVRVYHPCSGGNNGSGAAGSYMENPWIYAAILSTSHSFVVDNYNCGEGMGNLNVYGAIAQKFRGIVGILGGSGYDKEYIYDERLATDEPPYFLAPLKAGWRIERLTAPSAG
jgi:hypothetical protein